MRVNLSNKLSKSNSSTKRRAWGMRRRLAQRTRAYRVKPWLYATGPRTAVGRAAVSGNARKSGWYGQGRKALSCALSRQSHFRRLVEFYTRYPACPVWVMDEGRAATHALIVAITHWIADKSVHES